jgi:hypothetical protein
LSLLVWYDELDISNISLHRLISLLLVSDLFPLLKGSTRATWFWDITPFLLPSPSPSMVSQDQVSPPLSVHNVLWLRTVTLFSPPLTLSPTPHLFPSVVSPCRSGTDLDTHNHWEETRYPRNLIEEDLVSRWYLLVSIESWLIIVRVISQNYCTDLRNKKTNYMSCFLRSRDVGAVKNSFWILRQYIKFHEIDRVTVEYKTEQ